MAYPKPSNLTGVDKVIEYANTVSGGWLLPLFLMGVFIIAFTTLKVKGYRTSDSLFTGSFLMFLIGSLFWAAGMIAGKVVTLSLVSVAVCGIYSFLDTRY